MPEPDRVNQMGSAEEGNDFRYTFGKIKGALIRKRWTILITEYVVVLSTLAVLFYVPDRYTSEATVFAVQSRVPERYVVPTATTDVGQALEAMVQEVLSRPRLLTIINEHGLYRNRTAKDSEELIQLMRTDVKVSPVVRRLGNGDVNAFRIAFSADDPRKAQQVTQHLTALFIEQNLKTRADRAATTTEFLHEQLQQAKKNLEDHEARLRDFKTQYLGELPEQQQGNLGVLTSLETQLDSVMSSRNQAQQQKSYLEAVINQQARMHRRGVTRSVTNNGQEITPLEAARRELVRLQGEKRALLVLYTPQHPDVQKKDQQIKAQENAMAALQAPDTADAQSQPQAAVAPDDSDDDVSMMQLKHQLQANSFDIENLGKKEAKLRTEIEQVRERLNLTPLREQQLSSLQRDNELLKQHYGELLKKQQESQLATNLEKRQEGQQFRLADPPNLPTRPSSPQRIKISIIAIIAGLFAGVAIAILADFGAGVMHVEQDARSLALPLVVGVPLFLTRAEESRRSLRRGAEWAAAGVLISVVAVAEMYIVRRG